MASIIRVQDHGPGQRRSIQTPRKMPSTVGMATAVAGQQNSTLKGLGIDVENIEQSDPKLAEMTLMAEEQSLLEALDAVPEEAWWLRLWCAKEAVGKALGQGVVGGPQNIVTRAVDVQTGVAEMTLAGEMARLWPQLTGRSLLAHTRRDGNYIVAIAMHIEK